ncbi:3-oxoacyl-(acyl-carrier-protein) synthase 3 [Desulfurobacterium thermolithotrophum DSM 11699]|uniref:Beta-ketoacyl-[acyl-carrier-protein] synthase III n=1 Tax=Desulfurobacterium thermolithotrophum (strain DSM 11699 / BSA) TaxID=868864 RepID=F0S3V0_DESTD|nr:beta-ketoacyl-ACP synthase III [Desulfurobacterium thermolithotrophum]ADY73522.1 3-oxoacyl-(acyl-carrier-protein) synthase 3 [Desulfurobacterium thermolithotrophum DSM 11699]
MGIKIVSTGSFLPNKVLTNFDLEKMVDTSDEWITTRTGIKERRISEEETTSDLAAKAALRALSEKNPEDVDLIVVATATPDAFFPSTACKVQSKLANKKAIAFDISAACTGFIYGLYVADSIMRTKGIDRALVIGAERFSKIVNWKDRTTCILFGDGAGAALLEKSNEEGILGFDLGADGAYGDLLNVPSVGSNEEFPFYIRMKGNEVFKVAVRTMVESSIRVLEKTGISPSEIKLLVPHQANVRIIKAVAERLKISNDRIFINVNKYGNTSAASIPIALDEAIKTGRLKKGDLVLLVAFGGGFTWGSCVLKV